ncbi:conserved hypothetical protein [Methanocaldococcus sp. FS406-22]|uniref:hypothetical protein n=1 Tax=Methanocaldococcus sp. (strain FS406-22) TaxID=644281 RepID=UPI0001BF1770|nr:hypothetical protein [Methanocaldococcus sp. FS406-22]ADC69045.1 conserved hypothetical protein [Methanocaldococcus sp. FS406-22]
MNTYISTILVITTLFAFSIIAYEWGNNIIDTTLSHVSKEKEEKNIEIIKNLINDVICSGVNSERTFDETKIILKEQSVKISNGTDYVSFKVTTIEGIDYDVYLERGTLYIFIYNISAPYSDVYYIKYINSSIYDFGGNVTINYSNNIRYYYVNRSKVYVYDILMG